MCSPRIARSILGPKQELFSPTDRQATSALDQVSEDHVIASLSQALGDVEHTSVSIAHRLQSLAYCDQIAVVTSGRVSERGSKSALESDQASEYHKLLAMSQ